MTKELQHDNQRDWPLEVGPDGPQDFARRLAKRSRELKRLADAKKKEVMGRVNDTAGSD